MIKTLLVTGDDIAPWHSWKKNSSALCSILENDDEFDLRVSEDHNIFESKSALKAYHLIIFNLYNHSICTLSDLGKRNLSEYISSGGGFVVSHLGSASYSEWEEFGRICGRKWVYGKSGHVDREIFEVTLNSDHEISEGLSDFEIEDELYSQLVPTDTTCSVVAEAYSSWSGQVETIVFTHKYGKGRVFHNTLGHDAKAILDVNFKRLFLNGCRWAKGEVSHSRQ